MNSAPRRIALSRSEFNGYVSSLAQVAHVEARYLKSGEYVYLARDEFVAALAPFDRGLAEKVGALWDAMSAVRAHIQESGYHVYPSEPLEVGVGGHTF